MITLEEHTKLMWEKAASRNDKFWCGIECPNCSKELLFVDDIILTSNPGQKKVRCNECNYQTNVLI